MKLTEKQKRFADYYIESGNATDAARRAGYKQPHVQGSQNLEKLSVREYIDEQMKKLADKRIMGQREALELLTSIARGEMTEDLHIPTEMGIEHIEKMPDIRDRQKALESLLKRYPANEYEQLKNEQLRKQIKKLEAETKNEEDGGGRVVIVNDKERMGKAMQDDSDS